MEGRWTHRAAMSDHPPRLYSLKEAAELLSPSGELTARSLRTMARQGRLQLVRIAGRDFVTEIAISEMVAAATLPARLPPCRVDDCPPAYTCAEGATIDPACSSF